MEAIPDDRYRCPADLAASPTLLSRILIIGTSRVSDWKAVIENSCTAAPCDFLLLDNCGRLPDLPPQPPDAYSLQIVQLPLRMITPEASYFRLPYNDAAAYQHLLVEARSRLSQFLNEVMRWNREHGLLTFVSNFLMPQQNPMGRLLRRYDLRNFVHFVEKLNEALDEELQSYKNTFLLDIDQIASSFGRMHLQDDVLWFTGHAAALSDWDHVYDQSRLEPIEPASKYYPVRTQEFIQLVWNEVVAGVRTIRQLDLVKLVVVDIDDTLWRGVPAEHTEAPADVEGWPLGVVEALAHLKRRGVLLALVSKNSEERIAPIWNRVLGDRLALEDFAARKINWRSKAENIEEILSEVNLLSESVLFVDDNPIERASVQAAFPAIRAIGPNPYLWRRVLLWSPETQVASITNESAMRTETVQARVARETMRNRMAPEEFLATFGTTVRIADIASTDHEGFARALELINKTNQFNTNGRRWTHQECHTAFVDGTRFYAFEVADKFAAYGVVGVAIVRGPNVEQFVMSCRVVGLNVERAVISYLVETLGQSGHRVISASIEKTECNLLCRDLYKHCGFTNTNGQWVRNAFPSMDRPRHINVTMLRSPTGLHQAASKSELLIGSS